jgi:ketosteroid isomerase-like protein
MDRISDALEADDFDALEQLYAPDAVADTPDEGRLEGRDAVVGWLRTFSQAFSDISFELTSTAEAGDLAIDEGYLSATHTGAMPGPQGEIAPTGKQIRIRECDIITVQGGVVVSHRFYFDQLEFLGQLGALQPSTIVLPDVERERKGAKAR